MILDNHFHAVLAAPDLSQVMADFKRHTAQRILYRLREQKCEWLLNQLEYYCAEYKKKSLHQVWQEGFHPQAITDDRTMSPKLDYVHENPVLRGLVVAPEHWRYSSAHEWLVGSEPLFKCDQWR